LDSPENASYFEWSLAFLKRIAELGAGQIVVLGTCIEYEMQREPLSEVRTPLSPATTYARWKDTLRHALEQEFAHSDRCLSWARLFYPYGVGEDPARLCTSTILKLRHGERVELRTPHSVKDYIYIDDVARALHVLIEKRYDGAVNLGTGQGVSVGQIAATIARLVGRPDLLAFGAGCEAAPRDAFDHVVADSSRLRSLGWRPETTLETGLQQLINHLSS
jgi:dTDP-6-deoxy-L-talose 4-dehydrogenase (NAD+)